MFFGMHTFEGENGRSLRGDSLSECLSMVEYSSMVKEEFPKEALRDEPEMLPFIRSEVINTVRLGPPLSG